MDDILTDLEAAELDLSQQGMDGVSFDNKITNAWYTTTVDFVVDKGAVTMEIKDPGTSDLNLQSLQLER